ncbi:hypothetical protein I3760_16G057500 [Carya illinoinensis]|nr:hypothetical protein I3760_16G057500 [Carya illinoinensis]
MSLSSVPARLTLLALLSASTFYCFYKSRRLRQLKFSLNPIPNTYSNLSLSKAKIFFVSQTGTSEALAHRLFDLLSSNNLSFDLVDPEDYEPEDLSKESLVLIIASTWEDGKPPPNAKFFSSWLSESAKDFKVSRSCLSVNSWSSVWEVVLTTRHSMQLGANVILPVWEVDVDKGDFDEVFEAWSA